MAEPAEHQDDDYDSASDEDFNPDAPVLPNDDNVDSSSDDEQPETQATKKRNLASTEESDDFHNSGDEATIQSGLKKRRRLKTKQAGGYDDDEEGGEGGLVKTRAQRRAEIQEKKPLAQTTKSTVDVDAVFAQMAGSKARSSEIQPKNGTSTTAETNAPEATTKATANHTLPTIQSLNVERPKPATYTDETITIKRKYDFAGQTIEEEQVVRKDSAQARRYLEEQAAQLNSEQPKVATKPPLRRPKKSSIFDSAPSDAAATKAPKLNTLEKSKLDWAAHVDEEGITDELDEHRRAKDTYLGRMDFLDRMSVQREDNARSSKGR